MGNNSNCSIYFRLWILTTRRNHRKRHQGPLSRTDRAGGKMHTTLNDFSITEWIDWKVEAFTPRYHAHEVPRNYECEVTKATSYLCFFRIEEKHNVRYNWVPISRLIPILGMNAVGISYDRTLMTQQHLCCR